MKNTIIKMRRNSLQYTVLIIGTIIFATLIYLLVQAESAKMEIGDETSYFIGCFVDVATKDTFAI